VANSFIDSWSRGDPAMTVDTLDVWSADLPVFDGPVLQAKYAGIAGEALTDEQRLAWDRIRGIAARFFLAEVIVISTPMWNFGIPYRLKQLIDAISHKDVVFAFDGREVTGLLTGRTAVIAAARGGNFGDDFLAEEHDYQVRYLYDWLNMIGITDVHHIIVQKTFETGKIDQASREAGRTAAAALASELCPRVTAAGTALS
jgi:FMN-dependent NADH-azoreductase